VELLEQVPALLLALLPEGVWLELQQSGQQQGQSADMCMISRLVRQNKRNSNRF
jgi:hypothetical protein